MWSLMASYFKILVFFVCFFKYNSNLINFSFDKNVCGTKVMLIGRDSFRLCQSISCPSAQCLYCFDTKVKGECNYAALEELR